MLGIDLLDLTTTQYCQLIQSSLERCLPTTVLKLDICAKLQQHFTYQRLDLYNDLAYQQLQLLHWHRIVIYYLATQSNPYCIIYHNLYQSAAISKHNRIVLEESIGYDLQPT